MELCVMPQAWGQWKPLSNPFIPSYPMLVPSPFLRLLAFVHVHAVLGSYWLRRPYPPKYRGAMLSEPFWRRSPFESLALLTASVAIW